MITVNIEYAPKERLDPLADTHRRSLYVDNRGIAEKLALEMIANLHSREGEVLHLSEEGGDERTVLDSTDKVLGTITFEEKTGYHKWD